MKHIFLDLQTDMIKMQCTNRMSFNFSTLMPCCFTPKEVAFLTEMDFQEQLHEWCDIFTSFCKLTSNKMEGLQKHFILFSLMHYNQCHKSLSVS